MAFTGAIEALFEQDGDDFDEGRYVALLDTLPVPHEAEIAAAVVRTVRSSPLLIGAEGLADATLEALECADNAMTRSIVAYVIEDLAEVVADELAAPDGLSPTEERRAFCDALRAAARRPEERAGACWRRRWSRSAMATSSPPRTTWGSPSMPTRNGNWPCNGPPGTPPTGATPPGRCASGGVSRNPIPTTSRRSNASPAHQAASSAATTPAGAVQAANTSCATWVAPPRGTEGTVLDLCDRAEGPALCSWVGARHRPPRLMTRENEPIVNCQAIIDLGDPAAATGIAGDRPPKS